MSGSFRRAARRCLDPLLSIALGIASGRALRAMREVADRPRCPGPIRVVFLVQYLPAWNKIEPVHRAMLASEEFEPVIVCVPNDVRSRRGKHLDPRANETYAHLVSEGYEVINAVTEEGEWADLRVFNPDFVFHGRPYNNFMPACYRSGHVASYAQIGSMMYGASWTDNYVDVAFNGDYFKDVSIYFAEDGWNAQVFEDKFDKGVAQGLQEAVFAGSPVLEGLYARKAASDGAWEHFSAGGQRVLWTPRWSTDKRIGGSHFLEYRKWFRNYAERHPERSFIVRPHPLMFGNFVQTGEMSQVEVDDFRAWCAKTANVHLDESPEYLDTLAAADVLVMDTSSIVLEAFFTGNPIVYCVPDGIGVVPDYQPMADTFYEARSAEEVESALERLVQEDPAAIRSRHDAMIQLADKLAVGSTDRVLEGLKRRLRPEMCEKTEREDEPSLDTD